MGENSTESAMSPVQSVDSSPPKVKKSFFPKISLPNPVRLFRRGSSPEAVADITPAVQTTDFVPAVQAIDTGTLPVNADAPEFSTPSAPIDAVANKVNADLTAQMAAHVSNPFPGAKPPEMASGFTAPTIPPAETATASPITAEADAVAPTPIETHNPSGPPTPTGLTEESAA